MIRQLMGSLFILLLTAVAAVPGHAQPARDLFKGLDSIRLSATVGGPLDLKGGAEPKLFADDLKRFNRFRQGLSEALDQKLSTCGLFVDQSAADELSVEVSGRLEKLEECSPRYVYMIQAKVRNSKLKGRLISLRPVIGIAEGAGLEKTLIDAAVALIADELRSCYKPPAPKSGGR